MAKGFFAACRTVVVRSIWSMFGLLFAGAAQAAPTTWIFTGTLDGDFSVGQEGPVALQTFSGGETFTLTYVFDPTLPPEETDGVVGRWTGNSSQISTATLAIGGETYTVGNPSPLLSRNRFVGSVGNIGESLTDYTTENGGAAVASLGYSAVSIIFQIVGPFVGPLWPAAIDLSESNSRLTFIVHYFGCPDACEDRSRSFFDISVHAFETLTIVGSPPTQDSVPVPGALLMLGAGLIGLSALRWRRAA